MPSSLTQSRAAIKSWDPGLCLPPILWEAEDLQQNLVLKGDFFPWYHMMRQQWSFWQAKSWRVALLPPFRRSCSHTTWPDHSGGFSSCLVDSWSPCSWLPWCLGATLSPLQKQGEQPVTLQACEASSRTAGLRIRRGDRDGSWHRSADRWFGPWSAQVGKILLGGSSRRKKSVVRCEEMEVLLLDQLLGPFLVGLLLKLQCNLVCKKIAAWCKSHLNS